MPALFQTGKVVATPGVLAVIPDEFLAATLRRFVCGDWGLCDPNDAAENDRSVKEGFRLLGVYEHQGTRFWLICEADRSSTTFLLPSEY